MTETVGKNASCSFCCHVKHLSLNARQSTGQKSANIFRLMLTVGVVWLTVAEGGPALSCPTNLPPHSIRSGPIVFPTKMLAIYS